MTQSRNGQSQSERAQPKQKPNYTGERLKMLRPEIHRRVVKLLAEPREQLSIREICRRCHVTDDTVKAVEQRESVPIAARKQELMMQAARIVKRAADRVEDQIGGAPLTAGSRDIRRSRDILVMLRPQIMYSSTRRGRFTRPKKTGDGSLRVYT